MCAAQVTHIHSSTPREEGTRSCQSPLFARCLLVFVFILFLTILVNLDKLPTAVRVSYTFFTHSPCYGRWS